MKTWFGCGSIATVLMASGVYLAADSVARHPESLLGRCLRVSYRAGTACNPVLHASRGVWSPEAEECDLPVELELPPPCSRARTTLPASGWPEESDTYHRLPSCPERSESEGGQNPAELLPGVLLPDGMKNVRRNAGDRHAEEECDGEAYRGSQGLPMPRRVDEYELLPAPRSVTNHPKP